MRHKPGASEIYTFLVPCALIAGGKHEIRIRLRLSDNRVTFEGTCHKRVAEANDALAQSAETRPGGANLFTLSCWPWVVNMRYAIRNKLVHSIDIARCRTCDRYVQLWHNDCPFGVRSTTHGVDRTTPPFWTRIVRSGRAR